MGLFRSTLAVCQKELKDAFVTPLVYVLTGVFCIIIGWLFFNYILLSKDLQSATLTQSVLSPVFGNINFIFLFLAPLLTMKSFAEEKKAGTIDLLQMSQLNSTQIILGKFLSNVIVTLFMLMFSLVFPLVLAFSGYNDWGIIIANYVGIILSVMAYISVGMFASSVTDNQLIAALSSFAILMVTLLLALSTNASTNYIVGELFSYFSIAVHFNRFASGAVISYSVVFYLTFVAFFLNLVRVVLNARNW